MSETTWSSGRPFVWAAGKRRTNCHTRGNLGAPDMHPKLVVFQANAATGVQSITGIGFKPSRLELLATLPSATAVQQSRTVVESSGTADCHLIARDGSGQTGLLAGAAVWQITDGAGGTVAKATFTSYDDDGFMVNLTTAGGRPWVQCVAYP